MNDESLRLRNQLCFPIYAASRLITREYQPYLEKMGITYPQYLVLLILWESDDVPVNEIARRLILNTNTVTPLLKRMETDGIILRKRNLSDERGVLVELTEKGRRMKRTASSIPEKLAAELIGLGMNPEELLLLKTQLGKIIDCLVNRELRVPPNERTGDGM